MLLLISILVSNFTFFTQTFITAETITQMLRYTVCLVMMMMMMNRSVYCRCSKISWQLDKHQLYSWMACNCRYYSWFSTKLQRDGQAELACTKQGVSQNRPRLISEKRVCCDAEDFGIKLQSNGRRVSTFIRRTSWTVTVALLDFIGHSLR